MQVRCICRWTDASTNPPWDPLNEDGEEDSLNVVSVPPMVSFTECLTTRHPQVEEEDTNDF